MRWVIFGAVFLLPQSVLAAVSISEVAWMGSLESANYEWIELYNDGAAVDVTGWTLRDGMNLSIELVGVIPAGAHVVLERTSDGSAPGTAFLIYTGALVNTGATLQLQRADGALEDLVSGGEDWKQIGGDNVTKETAQYTSAGWVTAPPTPGRAITTAELAVQQEEAKEAEPSAKAPTSGSVSKGSSIQAPPLTLPGVTLALQPVGPTTGYVNQPIELTVVPSGVGEHIIASLQYEWNFGDGTATVGKEVVHTYAYPGTYVVTVFAGFKRQEQVARHEITILPVALSITTNAVGDVQVNNDSPYEVDLSEYRVVADSTFRFPPRTILLPHQTITIPRGQLGNTANRLLGVYDREAVVVAMRVPDALRGSGEAAGLAQAPAPPNGSIVATEYVAPSLIASDVPAEKVVAAAPEAETLPLQQPATATQLASVGAAPLVSGAERWPYVALAGVLLLATAGLLAAPRRNETV